MEVSNNKMPLDEFLAQRKDVLKMWKTGIEVEDLEQSFALHRRLGENKNVAAVLKKGRSEKRTLISLRCGKPTVEEQIKDLIYIQEAGADLLPVTLDSNTRNLHFDENEEALKTGKRINGYPIVNHGVQGVKRIMQAVSRPVTIKHGSVDARLVAEIGFGGGFSDINGNVYSWGLTYNKSVSILKVLKVQQYIARLMGYYAENGIILANEQGGGQGPGCFRVPCISISNTILGALISAGQGARCLQTAYGQGRNLVQDIASMRVLRKLSDEYMSKLGYSDVDIYTILHQWQGAFPENPDEAMGVICLGAATAVLGGADISVIKSTQEGVGIPTMESNAAGVRATREIIHILGNQRMPDNSALEEEMAIVEAESRAIIEAVLDIGNGDPALGTIKGIEAGIVEVPFTPSIYNYGKAIPVCDANGAYRFLECGNLPFPQWVKDYNKKKIDERVALERGRRQPYEMVLDDVFCMIMDRAQNEYSVSIHINSCQEEDENDIKALYDDNIVMGVIGSDSHAIGNRILEYALTSAGFHITNLGSFVSEEDFINAALETDAKVILVSSLGGHAAVDCEGFKQKLIEAGLGHVLLYIGGNLAVGKTDWEIIEKQFKDLGFNRIAKPNTRPIVTIKWLNEDLAKFH